jgi:hypothetical protein
MEWKLPTLALVVNNWSMNIVTMGVYGNYYLKRAIVAQVGLAHPRHMARRHSGIALILAVVAASLDARS